MADEDWQEELDGWMEPFLATLKHGKRRRWAPAYVQGRLGPGERKSLQPTAARLGLNGHGQLQHVITSTAWDDAPLRRILVEKADRLVGGPEAVLVIDDTALVKQGRHSVGVARQYCGCLGKRANCQVLVSLTLARDEVPVPVGLQLFLPEAWAADAERCARTGVPGEHRRAKPKAEIALTEIDRVRAAGARFGVVLADAGSGVSADFRQGLSARGLAWAVGIPRVQNVYPTAVELLWPPARTGRPRKHPVPSEGPAAAEAMLADAEWRRIARRRGTKGPLAAAFAAVRVRPAEGAQLRNGWHLPGDEVWLVGERRGTGERKDDLVNLPAETPLGELAAVFRTRLGGAVLKHQDRPTKGRLDQGALGVRAGAPAAQGGAGPRPLRGPFLDRATPACADDHDRLRLPPAPPAAGAGGRAGPDRRDRRPSRPCPPSGAGCWSASAVP